MALSKIDVANMLTGATPVANGGTAATTLAAAGLGKRPNAKPLIVNGSMDVSQRATSVTGKTSTDIYTVDRMSAVIASIGTYTIAQEAQTSGNAFANGFANAWRIDCTTADASPAASDQLQMQYAFEGQDLQLFKKGTSNAEKFTLAFWVKSNKTGTGNIQLKDKDNSNRQCTQSYTISSANTWEHKVCVFGADTTGAFDDDNAKSLVINWWLGSGTDSSSGTANHGTWEAQDDTKVNDGGTLNINDNTANDWSITGIQLEVGEFTSSTLPPFQHESYGENLLRCQRYFQHIVSGNHKLISYAHWASSSQITFILNILEMRAVPTIDYDNGNDYWAIGGSSGSTNTIDSLIIDGYSTNKCVGLYSGTAAGGTTGYAYYGFSDNASARLALVSEL